VHLVDDLLPQPDHLNHVAAQTKKRRRLDSLALFLLITLKGEELLLIALLYLRRVFGHGDLCSLYHLPQDDVRSLLPCDDVLLLDSRKVELRHVLKAIYSLAWLTLTSSLATRSGFALVEIISGDRCALNSWARNISLSLLPK
jgi:hypothetical protein